MQLTEIEAVPDAALPLAEVRDHLRLASGFGDAGLQDALLCGYLRAAIACIEGRIGKALLMRSFRLQLPFWRDPGNQALPLAPVGSVSSVVVHDGMGNSVEVPAGRWRLRADTHRPRLEATVVTLPAVPQGGHAEVVFAAGFGAWSAVPADLRQAVLLLAAQYHEFRHAGAGSASALPWAVASLIERWRIVRVLGGGA